MKAAVLMEFGSPGAIGKLTEAEWAEIERSHGALPQDYKDLISTFGFGSFGDILLFHPLSSYPRTSLDEGEKDALEFLRDQEESIAGFLDQDTRILGEGPERHYFAFKGQRWWHIDWEMGDVYDIGPDLVGFIRVAYTTILNADDSLEIAYAIWKDSSPKSPSKFFRPARAL
jgi:hypothetical protein